MDNTLFKLVEDQMPKFNPLIANGLAVEQMKEVENYIDQIFRCAALGFPPGLRYEGYVRCTPIEEYNEITHKRNNKRLCEIARSDLYLVKYNFSYTQNGKTEALYPRYLYLPFVNDAGIITLRGSRFMISPVLADRAISVEMDNIFIPLNCAKLKFEKVVQHFKIVNAEGQETVDVVWSPVHNLMGKGRKDGQRPTIDAYSTLAHYLFCYYGIHETFNRFANTQVVIGGEEVNETAYPSSKWIIFSPIQLKPRGVRDKFYVSSNIRLAIPRDRYNLLTKSLIGGFFYVVDHFPDRVIPEYIAAPGSEVGDLEAEKSLWMVLLGHIIFASESSEGELINKIREHLGSLDEYIDEMIQDNLRRDGVVVDNIYSLFVHIIETLPSRLLSAGDNVASMYGKRLTVIHYVLFDIIKAIMTVRFKLQSAIKKKPLTLDDINKIMNRELGRDLITQINRKHGEVTSISSPGDNKIFKITSNVVMQTKSGSGGRKTKANLSDPSKALHASIAEVGSFSNLPHSDPTGRSRISPYLMLEDDGMIKRNPEFIELLESVQALIQKGA